jgi:hypothetical protein
MLRRIWRALVHRITHSIETLIIRQYHRVKGGDEGREGVVVYRKVVITEGIKWRSIL